MRIPRPTMPHLSIRGALTTIVGILTVCLLVLGGVSIFEIRTLSAHNETLTNERIPTMKALGDIKTSVVRLRLRAAQYTAAIDPQQAETYAEQIVASAEEVDRNLAAYERMISSEQEAKTWKSFLTTWRFYLDQQNKSVAAKKAGQSETAVNAFNRVDKMFTTALSALDQNILLNKRLGEEGTVAARATADAATVEVAALGGGSLILAVLAGSYIFFRVSGPLRRFTEAMRAVSRGELATTIPATDRRNEIGEMARTLVVFRDGLAETERLRAAQLEQEKASAARVGVERHRIADHFMETMGALAERFVRSSGEVAEAARNLSATAEETTRRASAVSEAAEEASCNVQTVAASTEELAASVREINGQVGHSTEVAEAAAGEVANTEANIRVLSEAAEKIGDVVNLIKDIAGQTNLLALNATIEAARAGEAGRGFAVVASEVKQLAAQTAAATDEIASKIGEIQSATAETVGSIARIVDTIGTIREVTSSIAGAVEQQGSATQEISGNTQRAADGTAHVTGNIAGVGRAAEMTGAAANQLMGLSGNLSAQADELTHQVHDFVETLRSA